MTNRQAHEEAAGMNLDDAFFISNGINPDAEYVAYSLSISQIPFL